MCLRLWEETVIETESRNKWQSHCTITPTGSTTEHMRSLTSRRLVMVVTLCGRTHLCEVRRHYVGAVFSFFFFFFLLFSQLTTFIYFSGKNCSTPVSACASDVEFCKNGGSCSYNTAGEIYCVCPPGSKQAHAYSGIYTDVWFDNWHVSVLINVSPGQSMKQTNRVFCKVIALPQNPWRSYPL